MICIIRGLISLCIVPTYTAESCKTTYRNPAVHCNRFVIKQISLMDNMFQILVLDAGRLMEYDHPHILLQNQRSYFYRMVGETGPTMAPALHEKAAQVNI